MAPKAPQGQVDWARNLWTQKHQKLGHYRSKLQRPFSLSQHTCQVCVSSLEAGAMIFERTHANLLCIKRNLHPSTIAESFCIWACSMSTDGHRLIPSFLKQISCKSDFCHMDLHPRPLQDTLELASDTFDTEAWRHV